MNVASLGDFGEGEAEGSRQLAPEAAERVLALLRDTEARVAALPPADPAEPFVYWEYQGDDRLCALHCLNALFQGPEFSIEELSAIGQDLDERERRLLSSGAELTGDAAALLQGGSHNTSTDGFYSFGVLEHALGKKGAVLKSLLAAETRDSISSLVATAYGFLCNQREHWFVLRKVHNVWFNLNSLQPAPKVLAGTQATLSFLHGLLRAGQSIFLVGTQDGAPMILPEPSKNPWTPLNAHQVYLTLEQMDSLQQQFNQLNRELLAHYNEQGKKKNGMADDGKSTKESALFQWPTQGGQKINKQNSEAAITRPVVGTFDEYENDPELREALRASILDLVNTIPEPPPEPRADTPNAINVMIRMPDGTSPSRRFAPDVLLREVFAWLEKTRPEIIRTGYGLVLNYPKRIFRRETCSSVLYTNESSGIKDLCIQDEKLSAVIPAQLRYTGMDVKKTDPKRYVAFNASHDWAIFSLHGNVTRPLRDCEWFSGEPCARWATGAFELPPGAEWYSHQDSLSIPEHAKRPFIFMNPPRTFLLDAYIVGSGNGLYQSRFRRHRSGRLKNYRRGSCHGRNKISPEALVSLERQLWFDPEIRIERPYRTYADPKYCSTGDRVHSLADVVRRGW